MPCLAFFRLREARTALCALQAVSRLRLLLCRAAAVYAMSPPCSAKQEKLWPMLGFAFQVPPSGLRVESLPGHPPLSFSSLSAEKKCLCLDSPFKCLPLGLEPFLHCSRPSHIRLHWGGNFLFKLHIIMEPATVAPVEDDGGSARASSGRSAGTPPPLGASSSGWGSATPSCRHLLRMPWRMQSAIHPRDAKGQFRSLQGEIRKRTKGQGLECW